MIGMTKLSTHHKTLFQRKTNGPLQPSLAKRSSKKKIQKDLLFLICSKINE